MNRFNFKQSLLLKLKPMMSSLRFELRIQKNKFISLSLIAIIMSSFTSFLPYFMRFQILPWTLYYFYSSSLSFFMFVLAFSSTFFFSGIVCSEYKKKKGFAIIPLLNRHELLMGKFFANYLFNIFITAIYYIAMVMIGFYFYGPPILYTVLISFGLVMLYLLALCSLITFFSSFMPSAVSVIILVLSMFFFGFPLIQSIIPQFEPLYSFFYLYYIITESLNPELSYELRYSQDPETGDIFWSFPTIEAAIISFIIYFIIFFILALYIFKKKQM